MARVLQVFGAAGAIAIDVIGELIAPVRCAACDGAVRRQSLFCAACACTVERAAHGSEGVPGSCIAAFEYGGALATAIGRLKYDGHADLGPRLGRSMVPTALALDGAVDLVVPVPLHPRRLAERGYNQAALLAAPIARRLGATLRPRALARMRDTPQQVSMDRQSRLRNVEGAFIVREPARVRGARVLLVDDVRTTGATIDGCARALQEAGARRVFHLVLARRA